MKIEGGGGGMFQHYIFQNVLHTWQSTQVERMVGVSSQDTISSF